MTKQAMPSMIQLTKTREMKRDDALNKGYVKINTFITKKQKPKKKKTEHKKTFTLY